MTTETLEQRFDAAIGLGDGVFEPTTIGENLAFVLMGLVVQTAPDEEVGLRAYEACEKMALDEMVADVRRTVVRHVRAAR